MRKSEFIAEIITFKFHKVKTHWLLPPKVWVSMVFLF